MACHVKDKIQAIRLWYISLAIHYNTAPRKNLFMHRKSINLNEAETNRSHSALMFQKYQR